MKIVLGNTHLDPSTGGGYAHRTFALAHALKELGHDVCLVATDYNFGPPALNETAGFNTVLLRTLVSRFFVPAFDQTQLDIALQNASLVHLMGHWSVLNIWLARHAKKQSIPYVVCPAGALPPFGRSKFIKALFHFLFGKRLLRDAAKVIAVTAKEAANLAAFGVPSEKILIVPNGVPEHFFAVTRSDEVRNQPTLSSAPYILFVGRLNPIKGPDLLLQAYLKSGLATRGIHLDLAGPDEGMKESLAYAAREAGVETSVHFLGFLDQQSKQRAYSGALFLAIPSRSEAMSLVALEAAAMGRPVLLTDCCGFDEVASIGGGLVVPVDANAISEALLKLTAFPPAELDAMSA